VRGQNAVPANGEVTPTIADVSYRNYDGPLIAHALRWWVVAWATIRQSFSKSKAGYWVIFAFVAIGYLARGVFFYFGRVATQATGMNLLGEENAYATTLYGAQSAAEILLFATALTVGAGSIAADNRANALLVYLSKPITRLDYLIGKWMGIFLLLLAMVLGPNLLMYLFFVGTFTQEGFLKDNPYLFFQMLLSSVISPAIYASLMLGFSAAPSGGGAATVGRRSSTRSS
jgi:ABC-2 type transport system permease protein